jgi:hypothetical protein
MPHGRQARSKIWSASQRSVRRLQDFWRAWKFDYLGQARLAGKQGPDISNEQDGRLSLIVVDYDFPVKAFGPARAFMGEHLLGAKRFKKILSEVLFCGPADFKLCLPESPSS